MQRRLQTAKKCSCNCNSAIRNGFAASIPWTSRPTLPSRLKNVLWRRNNFCKPKVGKLLMHLSKRRGDQIIGSVNNGDSADGTSRATFDLEWETDKPEPADTNKFVEVPKTLHV